jgi:hypothetical protein
MHQLQPTDGGRHDGPFLHLRVEAVPLGEAALQPDGGLKDLRLVSHRRIGPKANAEHLAEAVLHRLMEAQGTLPPRSGTKTRSPNLPRRSLTGTRTR